MPASIERLRTLSAAVALVALAAAAVVTVLSPAHAADTPRRGGVLLAVIAAEPPSLDPHQEGTFANIQLVAPFYSLLLQFNPTNFPEIIGDLATESKTSPDGLTYTFKIRQGVRFHDGTPLTATDIKASYDKIVSPPAGVVSFRKNSFTANFRALSIEKRCRSTACHLSMLANVSEFARKQRRCASSWLAQEEM